MSDTELEETIRLLRVLEETLRTLALGSEGAAASKSMSSGDDTQQVA